MSADYLIIDISLPLARKLNSAVNQMNEAKGIITTLRDNCDELIVAGNYSNVVKEFGIETILAGVRSPGAESDGNALYALIGGTVAALSVGDAQQLIARTLR